MLSSLFNLCLFLFDIFIKVFVLGTIIYFYGESFVEFMKSALNSSNAPLTPEKPAKRKRRNDGKHLPVLKTDNKGKKKSITVKKENTSIQPSSPLHCRHRRSRTHSFTKNPSRSSLHIPSRSFSTSIPITSSRNKLHHPTPSYSAPTHSLQQNGQNPSRVGQLVQRFEIGRRPETRIHQHHRSDIMNSGMDSKVNDSSSSSSAKPTNTSHDTSTPTRQALKSTSASLPPTVCLSPGKLTTPTSTRAIDYRSIGFRPAFSSWERRTTEGTQVLVALPSLTSPVWPTHCPRQSHPST